VLLAAAEGGGEHGSPHHALVAAWRCADACALPGALPAACWDGLGGARVAALAAHPADARLFCCATSAMARLLRLDGARLAPVPHAGRAPPTHARGADGFVAATWLRSGRDAALLLASAHGDVHLLSPHKTDGPAPPPAVRCASGCVAVAALPGGGFALAGGDGSMAVYGPPPAPARAGATQQPPQLLRVAALPAVAVALQAGWRDDAPLLATCADGALVLLALPDAGGAEAEETASAEPLLLCPPASRGAFTLAAAERGARVVTCDSHGVRLWAASLADAPATLLPSRGDDALRGGALAVHPGGTLAAAGCESGGVQLIALCALGGPRRLGAPLRPLGAVHGAPPPSALAFSRGGGGLAAALGADVALLDPHAPHGAASGAPLLRGGAGDGHVTALAWTARDASLAVAHGCGVLRLWDVAAAAPLAELRLEAAPTRALVAAHDAPMLFVSVAGGAVLRLCAATLVPAAPPLRATRRDAPPPTALAVAPGDAALLVGTACGSIAALSLEDSAGSAGGTDHDSDASLPALTAVHGGAVTSLAAPRRGGCLFSAGADGSVAQLTLPGALTHCGIEDEDDVALLVAPDALAALRAEAAAANARAAEARSAAAVAARVAAADAAAAASRAAASAAARLGAERRRADCLAAELAQAASDADAAVAAAEARGAAATASAERLAASRVATAAERAEAATAARDAAAAAASSAAELAARAAAEALAEAIADGEARAAADAVAVERASAERDDALADAEARLAATEAECEAECEAMRAAHAARLELERDASLRLRGESGMAKRRAAMAARAADTAKAEAAEARAALGGAIARAEAAEAALADAEAGRGAAVAARAAAEGARAAAEAALFAARDDAAASRACEERSERERAAAAAKSAASERDAEAARAEAALARADADAGRRAASGALARAAAARDDAAAARRAAAAASRRRDAVLADVAACAASLSDAKALKAAVRAMLARHSVIEAAVVDADAATATAVSIANAAADAAEVAAARDGEAAARHRAARAAQEAAQAQAAAAAMGRRNAALAAELGAMREALTHRVLGAPGRAGMAQLTLSHG
jgi:hypothetical protein